MSSRAGYHVCSACPGLVVEALGRLFGAGLGFGMWLRWWGWR